MTLLKKVQTVVKNEGLVALAGASIKYVVVQLPYGNELLTRIREKIHPPSDSRLIPRPTKIGAQHTHTYQSSAIGAQSFPQDLCPAGPNPILTSRDVTDYEDCEFVADPFLWIDDEGVWHLFFEAYASHRDGSISHAVSNDHGTSWEYKGVVLDEDSHLSFPYVFEWKEEQYMIPEKGAASGRQIDLYRAREFPEKWERYQTLIRTDHRTDDTVAFRWEDRWWLFVGDESQEGLHAYYSDELVAGEWQEHDHNPIVSERSKAMRPGGRPLVFADKILLFLQDCRNQYGDKVHAYEVTELSSSTYSDQPLSAKPILEGSGGRGWNSGRMHHIDPWYIDGRWWCVVDGGIGRGKTMLGDGFSIGLYVSDRKTKSLDQNGVQ